MDRGLLERITKGFSSQSLQYVSMIMCQIKSNKPISHILRQDMFHIVKDLFKCLNPSAVPGIDDKTIYDIKPNLDEEVSKLVGYILSDYYKPKPLKQIRIYSSSKFRNIAISTVRDKLVQVFVYFILTLIYEPEFDPMSYGYRIGKSPQLMIESLLEELNHHKEEDLYILRLDIENCFPSLNHQVIISELIKKTSSKGFLKLIKKLISNEFQNAKGKRYGEFRKKGVPLGLNIAPILANIILDQAFDKYVRKLMAQSDSLIKCYRMADDIVTVFKSQQDIDDFLEAIKINLAKYKLSFNKSKTQIVNLGLSSEESFNILGFNIYRTDSEIKARTSELKSEQFNLELTKLIDRNLKPYSKGKPLSNRNLEILVEKINTKILGFYSYFRYNNNAQNVFDEVAKVSDYLNESLRNLPLIPEKTEPQITKGLFKPSNIEDDFILEKFLVSVTTPPILIELS
ncbi:MAG: hypothetical protein HRT47_04280 [Candidatus Caenarcaniphilales bacterium]|nr:hypothetical protein [Candidatus Caenarcaniphilales bacterium]